VVIYSLGEVKNKSMVIRSTAKTKCRSLTSEICERMLLQHTTRKTRITYGTLHTDYFWYHGAGTTTPSKCFSIIMIFIILIIINIININNMNIILII